MDGVTTAPVTLSGSSTTTAYDCAGIDDGRKIFAQLRYITNDIQTSDWSVPETFMCAYLPTPPPVATTDMATQDLIMLRWAPPPYDGGTPILGYMLYMKRGIDSAFNLSAPIYNGYQDPVTRLQMVTSYLG